MQFLQLKAGKVDEITNVQTFHLNYTFQFVSVHLVSGEFHRFLQFCPYRTPYRFPIHTKVFMFNTYQAHNCKVSGFFPFLQPDSIFKAFESLPTPSAIDVFLESNIVGLNLEFYFQTNAAKTASKFKLIRVIKTNFVAHALRTKNSRMTQQKPKAVTFLVGRNCFAENSTNR